MLRNMTGSVAALALVVALTAGCGGAGGMNATGGEGGAPSGESASQKPNQTVNQEPVDINWVELSGDTEETFNRMFGDAIRKKFPNVRLKFVPKAAGTTIGELVASGSPMDILRGSIATFYGSVYQNGLQMDITDLIKSHQYDLSALDPTLVELQRKLADGGIYGLPAYSSVTGLYYNKDLFDKFGVPYPQDNMTWNQVYELAKRMTRTDGGTQYYGYVTSPETQMLTNQLSLDPIDPKTLKSNFNSDSWKRFMQSIVQFYQLPGYQLDKKGLLGSAMRALFEKDMTAAMYTNYSGGTPPETMNWDVVTVPYYEEAPGVGPQVYPAYVYVTSNSKHKDIAFDIMAYITSQEVQLPLNRSGTATVLKDQSIQSQFGQDMAKFKGKHVVSMFPQKHATPMNYTKYTDVPSSLFNTAFVNIVTGEQDINTAMRTAAEEVDKKIAATEAGNATK